MKWNPMTRRHFLQGLGATLALPLLPSLLSKAEAQSVPNGLRRFIAVGFENGAFPGYWYPSLDTSTLPFIPTSSYGYRSTPISGLAGQVSEVLRDSYSFLGPSYTESFAGAIRNDMTLLRGIDGLMPSVGHISQFMLGGNAGMLPDESKRGVTIDQVLANSPKIYGTLPARRSLLLKGQWEAEYSYTHDELTNTLHGSGAILNPAEAFDRLFTRTNIAQPGPRRSKKVVDLVLEDYNKIKNSRRVSADDLRQLDSHMSQLNQLQASFKTLSCNGGVRPQETYTESELSARIKKHMDLMAIAIKCGITQVGVLGINGAVDHTVYNFLGTSQTYHEITHAGHNTEICKKVTQFFASHLPYLYNQLLDQDGTSGSRYIDNTLIYYGSHMAVDHHQQDMPVLLLGGRNFINAGQYIDYRHHGTNSNGLKAGRNYSQLLVSILAAMGLQPTDYKYPNVQGGWGTDRLGGDLYGPQFAQAGINPSFRTSRTELLPNLLKA